MGLLDRYKYITNYGIDTEPCQPYTPPVKQKREYVAPEVTPITIADSDSRSSDFITAHCLEDYRRTSFNLVLLPHVDLAFDIIAEEVYGLREYL